MADPVHDVAISFLQRDEPLALKLQSLLSESLNVFVYSKKQEDLAGTDGMESFREAFRSQSRLNVVLFRSAWGTTPWTRIEETAIKDKCLADGWDSLLVVMVDDSKAPVWLPDTKIRLNFSQYPVEQLVGAIKTRAENQGSALRAEDALTRALRLQQDSAARTERATLLQQKGHEAAQQEFTQLGALVNGLIAELKEKVSALSLQCGSDGRHWVVRTKNVSINFFLDLGQPSIDTKAILQEWNGPLAVPPAQREFIRRPKQIGRHEFGFDYQAGLGWCWRHDRLRNGFLTTRQLAEHVLKLLMEIHDRFEKGEIKGPSDDDNWEPIGPVGPYGWMGR